MQPDQMTPSPFLSLLPLIIMSIPVAIVSYMLAREKGRNVVKWTILGVIPIFGFLFVWYFVGAANWKHEKKLNEILELLKGQRVQES